MDIRPQAMAIPAEINHLDQGKYGPIYPKTPACYGFSILAKIIPGRESIFHQYAKNIEALVKEQPDVLGPLKLHYLRWLLFPINGDTDFMYQGIFDTEFDKYTEDAVALFSIVQCRESRRSGARIVTRFPPRQNRLDSAMGSAIPRSKAVALPEPIPTRSRSRRASLCWVMQTR